MLNLERNWLLTENKRTKVSEQYMQFDTIQYNTLYNLTWVLAIKFWFDFICSSSLPLKIVREMQTLIVNVVLSGGSLVGRMAVQWRHSDGLWSGESPSTLTGSGLFLSSQLSACETRGWSGWCSASPTSSSLSSVWVSVSTALNKCALPGSSQN